MPASFPSVFPGFLHLRLCFFPYSFSVLFLVLFPVLSPFPSSFCSDFSSDGFPASLYFFFTPASFNRYNNNYVKQSVICDKYRIRMYRYRSGR